MIPRFPRLHSRKFGGLAFEKRVEGNEVFSFDREFGRKAVAQIGFGSKCSDKAEIWKPWQAGRLHDHAHLRLLNAQIENGDFRRQ